MIGYTQWGYQLQFIIQQWQIREAVREAWIASLPDRAFLRVSLAEIEAHGKLQEAGRECWYRGHLYDIIRQRTEGETTWLFCLDDQSEERLIQRSDELIKANLDHPDKRAAHSLTLSFGDLICETLNWRVPTPPFLQRNYISGGSERLPYRSTEILIPPPRA